MSANWLGALDTSFWNTGRVVDGKAQHPVDKFWAERFLVYDNDPASGPLRKPDCDFATDSDNCKGGGKVATAGLRGHWFPFGGGASKCPGEALAKRSMLSAVAMALMHLHIRLDDPIGAGNVKSGHRALPFGSHSFDRAVPGRLKRRIAS